MQENVKTLYSVLRLEVIPLVTRTAKTYKSTDDGCASLLLILTLMQTKHHGTKGHTSVFRNRFKLEQYQMRQDCPQSSSDIFGDRDYRSLTRTMRSQARGLAAYTSDR